MADPTPEQLDGIIAKLRQQRAQGGGEIVQGMLDKEIAKYEALKIKTEDRNRTTGTLDKQSALADTVNPFAERTPEQQAAYEKSLGIIRSQDLARFGGPNEANRTVAQNELDAGVNLGPSAWKDSASAFDDIGPSAWKDATSAYDTAGKDTEGYYRGLMNSGGTDAISERDYQKKRQDAELLRKSNTNAALADLEMRGQGSAGGSLLAELSNQQAAVGDVYSAGLDAAATAQARRDNAASGLGALEMQGASGADALSALTNNGVDGWAQRNAAGQDTFSGNRNQGLDAQGRAQGEFTQNTNQFNAGAYGDAADTNINRDWNTADKNTNVYNENLSGNADKTAAGTGAYLGALGLTGGQSLGLTGADLSQAEFDYQQQKDKDAKDPLKNFKTVAAVGQKALAV